MPDNIGFIGLGAMGLGMAANLAKAGHQVHGYDPSPERAELAREKGIVVCGTPRECAEAADEVVFSVVRTKEQTEQVLLGDGVVAAGKPLVVAVASTLDPSTMRELARQLQSHDVQAVDTTMSGGPWGAEAGTLTLMVSGASGAVDTLRPHLDVVGGRTFVVGDEPGTGQATKLAVQLAFGVNMMGVFEALQVVRSHGVPEDMLMEIMSRSVGGSWVTENWDRVKPWWEVYVPGEDLDILLKDLRSVLRESDASVTAMPMSALTFQLLRHVWQSVPSGAAGGGEPGQTA